MRDVIESFFIKKNNMLPKTFFKLMLSIFLFVFLSCKNNNETVDIFPRIEIRKTNDNTKFLNASEIISDIEYIPLETSQECLIDKGSIINISKNFIIVSAEPSCLLFSRKGNFIRHIGNKGNGPEDFLLIDNVKIDEESGMIYLLTRTKIIAYRISGEFVKSLDIGAFKKKSGIPIFNAFHWKDDLCCAAVDLNSGKELYRFVIFTLDGDIVKLFTNYNTFDKKDRIWWGLYASANIFLYNGLISFKEVSDTLFRVSEQLDLVPEVIIDLCGQDMPENKLRDMDVYLTTSFLRIWAIFEIDNYILFDCMFFEANSRDLNELQFCIYDKNSRKLTFIKSDPLANFVSQIYLPNHSGVITPTTPPISFDKQRTRFVDGFVNDIDGGLPFWPSKDISIQNNNQLVDISNPSFLIEMLTEEYFLAHEIKDMKAHIQLKNLLKNINGDDNPVLIVITFK